MKNNELSWYNMDIEEILGLEFDTEITVDYIKDIQQLKSLK